MNVMKATGLLLAAMYLPVFPQAGAREYPSKPIRRG